MARTFRFIIVIKVNSIDLTLLSVPVTFALAIGCCAGGWMNSFSMRFAPVEVQKVPPPYKSIRESQGHTHLYHFGEE